MRQFLKSLSINTLGFAAVVACLIVIIVSDPPKSICDAEIDNFKKSLSGIMYPNVQAKIYEGTLKADRDLCRDRSSPGACVALFDGLTKFLEASAIVSEKCQTQLGEREDYQAVLIKSLDLMVNLAWGPSAPPATPAQKNGWFNASDVYLYCRLKNRATLVYGELRWNNFREKYFTELPGAKALNRQQVWEKSLLSTNCNSL